VFTIVDRGVDGREHLSGQGTESLAVLISRAVLLTDSSFETGATLQGTL